jgi:hypothetical protein
MTLAEEDRIEAQWLGIKDMTAHTFEKKLIPEDVLAILQAMSPEQRQQVFDFVAFLAQRQDHREEQPSESFNLPKRTRDLDRGAVLWISDDFDDSLPFEQLLVNAESKYG